MSSLRIVSAAGLSLALLAACQTLQPSATRVVATGDPLKDPAAVQAAVDRGGKVLLAGTFDFGERGRVTITRDVQIVGEDEAVIRGGFFTFYSPVPDTLPAAAGPKIAIRDLHFVGARWAPINIGHASGLTVTGNRIDHVVPAPLPMRGVDGGQAQAGILFGMAWAQRDLDTRRYAPGVFTGRVVIADNFIDVTSAAPARTLGYGVFGQWTTGIDATIGLNTVTGASRTAIEVIDHYRGADGTGQIIIVNNMLTTPAQGLPFPSAITPIGVVGGYYLDRAAAADPARSVGIEVNGNMIEDNAPNSRGIWMLANNTRVVANHVVTTGSSAVAIAVVGATGVIRDNTVTGNGAAAISIGTFDVLVGTRNQLARNDLQKFTPSRAHLMFGKGTSDNVSEPLAAYATIADDGARNTVR